MGTNAGCESNPGYGLIGFARVPARPLGAAAPTARAPRMEADVPSSGTRAHDAGEDARAVCLARTASCGAHHGIAQATGLVKATASTLQRENACPAEWRGSKQQRSSPRAFPLSSYRVGTYDDMKNSWVA